MHLLVTIAQIIVALGLLNVWLLRSKRSTDYRGGSAKNLKQEFTAYGLPETAFYIVGALKIFCAIALLVGIWLPQLVNPAAYTLIALMLGALAMHVKAGDPPKKSLPAACVLGLCLLIAFA